MARIPLPNTTATAYYNNNNYYYYYYYYYYNYYNSSRREFVPSTGLRCMVWGLMSSILGQVQGLDSITLWPLLVLITAMSKGKWTFCENRCFESLPENFRSTTIECLRIAKDHLVDFLPDKLKS